MAANYIPYKTHKGNVKNKRALIKFPLDAPSVEARSGILLFVVAISGIQYDPLDPTAKRLPGYYPVISGTARPL